MELYNLQYASFLFFSFDIVHMFAIHVKSLGSTSSATSTESSVSLIAKSINRAHKATRTVTILLKNMVQPCLSHLHKADFWSQHGARNVIGSKFSDLAAIIAKIEDKKRVGICLDTCKPISLFLILTKYIEFFYRFRLCSGM